MQNSFRVRLVILSVFFAAQAGSAQDVAKDKLIVETILRMDSFDYQQASANVIAAIDRFLVAEVATETYFTLVNRFRITKQEEILLKIALDDINGKGVQAVQAMYPLDATEHIAGAIRSDDISDESRDRLLRALALSEHQNGLALLVGAVTGDLPAPRRIAATRAMGASRSGERALLRLAVAKELPADLLLTAADVLHRSTDTSISEEAARYLVMPATSDAEALPPVAELVSRKGDAEMGKEVYQRACFICHQIGSEGLAFGPALTEIGDKLPKDALYASILEPSAAISFGFEGFEFSLKDGTSRVGIIASETDAEITVRIPGGANSVLEKSQLDSRKKLTDSLMPANLQAAMSTEDLVNLIEFLASLKK